MKFLELVIIFISKSCGVNSAVFVTSSDLFDVFLGFKFMFSSSSGLDFQWKSRPIIKRSTLPASWSTRTMRKFVGPNVIHEIIRVRLGKIKRIHIHIHSSKFTIQYLISISPCLIRELLIMLILRTPCGFEKKGGSTGVHQGRSLVALITQRISSAPPQQVMAGASLTGTKGTGPLNWSWELRGPTWSNRNPPTRSFQSAWRSFEDRPTGSRLMTIYDLWYLVTDFCSPRSRAKWNVDSHLTVQCQSSHTTWTSSAPGRRLVCFVGWLSWACHPIFRWAETL